MGLYYQAAASASRIASQEYSYEVKSLTIQEPILRVRNIIDLANRAMRNTVVGEPSDYEGSPDDIHIPEPRLLHDLDLHGNEPGMFVRMFQASVLHPVNMHGLTRAYPTMNHIGNLINRGIPAMAIFAKNSGMTQGSHSYLRTYFGKEIAIVTVNGVEGQHANHLVDENAAVLAIGIALGTRQ